MKWSNEQVEAICRSYSRRQSLACPECEAAVGAESVADKEKKDVVTFTCTGCGRSARGSFMTIAPEDFIRAPYDKCPQCGEEKFGLLGVHGDSYSKRCASCLHLESFALPALRKKVIYLDQMAISNMMFALNPDTKQFREGRVDPFWRTLFEKLDTLAKLQIIVCPDTEVQDHESLVHQHSRSLKRVYEQFALGVSFMDTRTIERFQVLTHARDWIAGEAAEGTPIDRQDVMHGSPDAWTDTLIIAARSPVTEEQIEAHRVARDSTHEDFRPIFERWQAEPKFDFDGQFKREVQAAGAAIWRAYVEWVGRYVEIQRGLRHPSVDDIVFPSNVVLVHQLHEELLGKGLGETEAWRRVYEYLGSPSLEMVPSVRISCMLWAALARRAASGMKKMPTRGIFNDVRVIAAILPYCDAMFLDNEMRSYLGEQPLVSRMTYGTRIFSSQNRDEFLAYLDELAREVPVEHLKLVEQVYGESWTEPFTRLFERS